jgi:hypothetical protein
MTLIVRKYESASQRYVTNLFINDTGKCRYLTSRGEFLTYHMNLYSYRRNHADEIIKDIEF